MKESNPGTEPIGQNLIKLISNLCFSVFVFSVLIFTVIAITYQPPDPWLESAPALTKLFTESENATFQNDNSIIKTGEDLQSENATFQDNSVINTGDDLQLVLPPSVPPVFAPSPITGAVPPASNAVPITVAVPPASSESPNSKAVPPASNAGRIREAVPPATKESPIREAVPPTSRESPITQAVPPASSESPNSEAVPPASNAGPIREAVPPATRESPITEAVPPTSRESPITEAVPPASSESSITQAVIEKNEEKIMNSTKKPNCEGLGIVNCSDPRVLITVRKFNLKAFKSIVFLEYQKPVNGSKPDECDVSWKFRNKKEKSWRKYRDFRRFKFGIGANCAYKVVHAGRWHSGINARPFSSRTNGTKGVGNGKFVPKIRDDEINDTIPTLGSDMNFRKGRYLYYSRGGDYCKGMNQYLWSFLCGLGEAMYLNRTFVMDLNLCLAATYTRSKKDEEGKDFRYYFDFEHLKEEASIVEEGEFLRDWKKWDKSHKRKVPVRKVVSHKVTPMQLKKDKSTIIWRQFDAPEPENYWYRVCEGQASKYIQRPWHAVWKSKRLMNIVAEISGRMDWDFDAIHVIRGEKAQNKELWPHLDYDTSPDSLLQKLKGMIQPWRNVYIATNEPFYNYFDKLRSSYTVHLLDDYKELWENTSEWYNETSFLNNGKPVEFDGYMRVAVDTEVFYRGKTRVETFYNLTKDCKNGINTC